MTPETDSRKELARLGRTLVNRLFVLFKTSLNYSEGHAAIDAPVVNVLKVVREILRQNEEASLRVRGGHLYLAEMRLKHDAAGFEAARFIIGEMKRNFVGAVSFSLAVTADDIRRFVYALREVEGGTSSDIYAKVLERMQHRMIANIEVETLPEELETDKLRDGRLISSTFGDSKLRARMLYKKAISEMEEVMGHASAGQSLRLRGAKRVVQRMIDLLARQESSLLGVTTTRCRAACVQHHAVKVCILSLVMGRRLGMSKFQLCELGMAALFHDIGEVDVPREILDRPAGLTRQEQQWLEAHPVHGVKKIMSLKGLDVMSARIITAIFEHHLLADFSGYPRFPYKRLSLSGRIISIADCFEGLTSWRGGGGTPYPPDKALRIMMTQAGKAYDQPLLKLFINCVGMHGIGSLLLLDSKELAVVVESNPDPALWDNPRVRIISDPGGREIQGEVVDLALCTPARVVVAILDPHSCNLEVDRYFH